MFHEASIVGPRKCVSAEMKYSQIHRSVVTQGAQNTAARESAGAEKRHFLATGDQSDL